MQENLLCVSYSDNDGNFVLIEYSSLTGEHASLKSFSRVINGTSRRQFYLTPHGVYLQAQISLLSLSHRVATFHFSQFDKLAIMTAMTPIAAPLPIERNNLRGDTRENQV